METRGHLFDANEEQLKTLISQAYPPVESPPVVREEVFKHVMAEFAVISRKRSFRIVSLWERAFAVRPLLAGAALVAAFLLVLSLVAYNVPLPWNPSQPRVAVDILEGSGKIIQKDILGRETSTRVKAGDEKVVRGEWSIATTEDQDMTVKLAEGTQIYLERNSLLSISPRGAKEQESAILFGLQKGGMQYTGDSNTSASFEMPGVRAEVSEAVFRARVIDSNHVQLASDRGDITVEVGDRPFVVHEWEEIDTALALDEMVRPQPPIIEIPGDRTVTKEAVVLIQGRAQPGSMVVMSSSDGHLGQTLANAQGHFEYEIQSLSENDYEIWAVATGPRGTTSSESNHIHLEFDRTPPKLEIISPYWPDVFSSPILLEGMTEPGAHVFVNEIEVAVDGQGRFSIQIPFQTGDNKVDLRVSDAAGNEFVAGMVIRLH
ncbi:MAG: Ig-like domain-containing protein [Chloroflexota bacterium]|nr:hypothetical protein [Anaerolineae bacterium]